MAIRGTSAVALLVGQRATYALEHLTRAVELDPSDAEAYGRLSAVLRETGDADGAAEAMARSRRLAT